MILSEGNGIYIKPGDNFELHDADGNVIYFSYQKNNILAFKTADGRYSGAECLAPRAGTGDFLINGCYEMVKYVECEKRPYECPGYTAANFWPGQYYLTYIDLSEFVGAILKDRNRILM